MIDLIKSFFGPRSGEAPGENIDAPHHDITVATCALFIEMAGIDGEFSEVEREQVISILRKQFGLSEEHAIEVARLAGEELEGSIDLWRFTNLINQNYSREEKLEVARLMWRVVYADGHLSDHENYLVRKLGRMLRLDHRELIDAKLSVLNEKRGSQADPNL